MNIFPNKLDLKMKFSIEINFVTHNTNVLRPKNFYIKLFDSNQSPLNHHYYSDITAYYDLLNNSNADIKGVFQYRRFLVKKYHRIIDLFIPNPFSKIISYKQIIKDLDDFDLITRNKIQRETTPLNTVRNFYYENHIKNDLNILESIIQKHYPEYYKTFQEYLESDWSNSYYDNILIAKKDVFNNYSAWLLNILMLVEKNINFDNRQDYQKRVLGFLSERLFNVYIQKNGLSVKEYPIRVLDKKQNKLWGIPLLINYLKYKLIKTFKYFHR